MLRNINKYDDTDGNNNNKTQFEAKTRGIYRVLYNIMRVYTAL